MKSVPVAQFMTREPVTVVTRDAGVGGVGFCLDCGDRAHTGDDGPDSGNPD